MKLAKIFCATLLLIMAAAVSGYGSTGIGTVFVSAATEEQSASIDEVASASKKLAELADELTNSTSKFKI